jgi:hypothetical protein
VIHGQPASALELHDMARHGRVPATLVARTALNKWPHVPSDVTLLKTVRHLSVGSHEHVAKREHTLRMSRLPSFLHLVDDTAEPYPEARKWFAVITAMTSALAMGLVGLRSLMALYPHDGQSSSLRLQSTASRQALPLVTRCMKRAMVLEPRTFAATLSSKVGSP